MDKKKYDIAVIIGRFQPFHNGHINLLTKAASLSDNIIILVGSANQPATPKNPWTWQVRVGLIEKYIRSTEALENLNVEFLPLHDHAYNDPGWVEEVQESVIDGASSFGRTVDASRICLVGHHKDNDSSTYYLDMFPQWEYEGTHLTVVADGKEIDATNIRNDYYIGGIDYRGLVPETTGEFLTSNFGTPSYVDMRAEHRYYQDYPSQWGNGPHVTTDAFVYCCGHLLLIRRGEMPGKGLFALPGGFLNNDESIAQGIVRELREETLIKVPVPVLHGSMKHIECFDAPKRSLRGRVITHCGLINLRNDTSLPEIRGADDADKAVWVPISSITDHYRTKMFEDHFDIVMRMKSLIK